VRGKCEETGIRRDGMARRSMRPTETGMERRVNELDRARVCVLTSMSRFDAVFKKYIRKALFSKNFVSGRKRHLVFLGETGSARS